MNLVELIQNTTNELTIIGTIPLYRQLVDCLQVLYQALKEKHTLRVNIFYESDSNLFYQSLSTGHRTARNRTSFAKLSSWRTRVSRLREFVLRYAATPEEQTLFADRMKIRQVNLNLPLNVIRADKDIYVCPVLNEIPSEQMYRHIESDDIWYSLVNDYIEFYIDDQKGAIYQSEPVDEMIVMYDKNKIPRGVFPRQAFYKPDFQRYSVWLLIFNRKD